MYKSPGDFVRWGTNLQLWGYCGFISLRKTNIEADNQPFDKESHLNMFFFRGV